MKPTVERQQGASFDSHRDNLNRIIFDIQEQSEEGPRVRVLRIWNGSGDRLTAEDIDTEH